MRLSLSSNKKAAVSKAPRFVLLVGDEGAILAYVQGGKVLKRLFAPNTDMASVRPFNELFHANKHVPITVLVDVIDQNYVRHDLPPVSPMSVGNLIKRRLERDFAAEDIKGALKLGRDSGGRKDWNYLLIALSNTPNLAKWLEFAAEQPNRFDGIYLLPVEMQPLIQALSEGVDSNNAAGEWHILVSHNKVGGFRQVVFRGGKMVFTRLAQPVGETMPEVIAGNVEQEVLNTIEYIKRIGFQESAGLKLTIIVAQGIKEAIDEKKFKSTQIRLFTPYEMANTLGLSEVAQPGDHFGDVVLAAFFGGQSRHILRLDNPLTAKLRQLEGIRLASRGAAAALAAFALYTVGDGGYRWYEANNNIDTLTRSRQVAQQELETVTQESKTLPVDINQINDLVDVYHRLSLREALPFDAFKPLLEVTGTDVLVSAVNWNVVTDKTAGADGAPPPAAPPATPGASPGAAANPNNPNAPYPIDMTLELNVLTHTEDADSFLAFSKEWLERVKAQYPGYEVSYVDLPGRAKETESISVTFDKAISPQDQIFGTNRPVKVKLLIRGTPGAKPATAPETITNTPGLTPPPPTS